MIIATIIGLVVAFTKALDHRHENKYTYYDFDTNLMDLTDVVMGSYYPNMIESEWHLDNKLVFYQEEDASMFFTKQESGYVALTYDQENDEFSEPELLISDRFLKKHGCYRCSVKFSSDLTFALIEISKMQIYRHSFTAEYKAIELATKRVQSLSIRDKDPVTEQPQYIKRFRYAQFGTAENKSQIFLFSGSQIFYLDTPFAKKFSKISQQKSEQEFILSGIPDWVYEEEVLETNEATWF